MATSNSPTLENFLSKFGSTEKKFIDSLDPLITFDVIFDFYPTLDSSSKESTSSWSERLKKKYVPDFGKILDNTVNNMTGGIVGAITNSKSEENSEVSLYKNKKIK